MLKKYPRPVRSSYVTDAQTKAKAKEILRDKQMTLNEFIDECLRDLIAGRIRATHPLLHRLLHPVRAEK